MNVLSLFDGMACGLQALKQAGIPVKNYFASEIDRYAIKIALKNHPEIQHLGDVISWREWHLPKIDLLIGGSPCQGFSMAGKRLNFDDPRSSLFFEYVRCLRHFNPKYFLLENVSRMKKEIKEVISAELGVEPILIDSALVSGQQRQRLYWCNWTVDQPKDRGVYFKDALTNTSSSKIQRYEKLKKPQLVKDKNRPIQVGVASNMKGHDILKRIYSTEGKCPTLTAICGGNQEKKIAIDNYRWRNITPIEGERLQTLQDDYTEGVSNTQRGKMIGNGWNIETIVHILKSTPQPFLSGGTCRARVGSETG